MIDRKHFLDALLKECEIAKHLFEKIPTDAYDFRPTPGQRSTLELLRYLAICASAPMNVILNGNNEWSRWKEFTAHTTEMTPEQFPAMMDRQAEEITKLFNAIPDADFMTKEVKHPTGETMLLGVGLMRMPLSWLVAYRMQLFLYAKQTSPVPEELGTSNNWRGTDRKKPA